MDFYNNSEDEDISDIDISSLSDEAYDFFELDLDDCDNINISWSDYSDGVDVDMGDEDTFALITLEEDDDDDYTSSIDSFDDISDFDF